MPRKPGRPRPSGTKAKRVRPSAQPKRFTEAAAVIQARIAAAEESLKILSGPPAAPSTIALARSINELTDRSIVIPHFNGVRGNPILFAASYVHEVAMGERHIGCRKLANEYPDDVFRYQAAHDRFTTDLDTPDDYARTLARVATTISGRA